jgi:hypothetical protein
MGFTLTRRRPEVFARRSSMTVRPFVCVCFFFSLNFIEPKL